MRFGVCAPLAHLGVLTDAGFDYIEPGLAPTLRPESSQDEVMPPLTSALQGARLVPETWNVMLPGDLKVVGDAVDTDRQRRFLDAAFARASALGGQVAVFGSGGSRAVPDGFSRESAQHQIVDFLQRAGEAAARHGMTVAIEPLNARECNILNSVAEAVGFAQLVNHPAVRVLSDLYHVTADGQSYAETRAAGDLLAHVHVAGASGRRAPAAEDREFLTGYFRPLKEMGYAGRISVEGQWENLEAQAAETLAVLRAAWDEA